VFGSPKNKGVIKAEQLEEWLRQASKIKTVNWIFFEGGEPFLNYRLLLKGIELSKELGFETGIVTNGFWAKNIAVAEKLLRPFAGKLDYLQISCDELHGEIEQGLARNAVAAAEQLNIESGLISVDIPKADCPAESGDVLFKGRAAEKMTDGLLEYPWNTFTRCEQENLNRPSRAHVDPFGYVHLCQGITIGNLNNQTLKEIVDGYDPKKHPVIGPIIRGGPAALVKEHELSHKDYYVDACHLCYSCRKKLAAEMPETLAPPLLYGDLENT
jgi:hypothetical protein